MKITDRIFDLVCTVCISAILILVSVYITHIEAQPETTEPVVLYHADGNELHTGVSSEKTEDSDESARIAIALEAAVGTEEEREMMGYDYSFVCSCIMAEGGGEYNEPYFEPLIWQLCGAVINATDGDTTPEDVCREYKYATTKVPVSDAVQHICNRVFIWGDAAPEVGGATVFWSDRYLAKAPDYHATLEETMVTGPVHFCKED